MLTFIKDPRDSCTSASTLTRSHAVGAPTHPPSQMTMLRHREVKELPEGHRASKWQSWESNPGSLLPDLMLVISVMCRKQREEAGGGANSMR